MEDDDSFGSPKQVTDEDIRKTLQRVEQNDATLKTLYIGSNHESPMFDGHHIVSDNNNNDGVYNNLSVVDDELSRLGDYIGTNTNLITLEVQINRTKGEPKVIDRFYEGLKSNSSIKYLTMHCSGLNLVGGVLHKILNAYQANSSRLTALHIDYTNLQNEGDNIITATLGSCTNLKIIKLTHCSITDEMLWPMVETIRGEKLKKLDLSNNDIGNTGCETIATLLEDPNTNTSHLCLSQNQIGNEGMTSIANSLMNNTMLDTLELYGNTFSKRSAEDIFSKMICNKSSINSIYLSNHTLENMELTLSLPPQIAPMVPGYQPVDDQLLDLLRMNRCETKGHVAINKILKYHPNIDMEQFFEWDKEGEQNLKALPYIMSWFERARTATRHNETEEYHIETKKLSAMFQFAQAMPIMFVSTDSNSTIDNRKRKRDI